MSERRAPTSLGCARRCFQLSLCPKEIEGFNNSAPYALNKRMYNCARGGIQNKPAEMFTEVSELINTEASNH